MDKSDVPMHYLSRPQGTRWNLIVSAWGFDFLNSLFRTVGLLFFSFLFFARHHSPA